MAAYAFEQADEVLSKLVLATKQAAHLLIPILLMLRCGMFLRAMDLDHLHSKLFPMHGTGSLKEWDMIESEAMDRYFDQYQGISVPQ